MKEQWRFIPGLPHTYMVSDRGRVYSIRAKRLINENERGDLTLYVDKEPRRFLVVNLVKAAFGLGCSFCDCEDALNCWRCGHNPNVAVDRAEALRRRGFSKNILGLRYLKIMPRDYGEYTELEDNKT